MKLKEVFGDLWLNQRALTVVGLGFLVLFLVLTALSAFDSTQVLGINRWIKPMKFAVSIAIYLLTLAVFLRFLPGREKSSRVIAWGAILMLTGEMVLILMQAARGTTSHFNHTSSFDDGVYSLMGMMIVVNTALIFYLTYLYFRAAPGLPPAIVWGMRLGLVVFLLASFEGGYMSAQTGHAVGARDGGAGLPLVNWSTEAGDLRVAHFVGMHALQAVPLFALLVTGLEKRFAAIRATALTVVFTLIYTAMFSLAFVQALRGTPLLGREIVVTQKSEGGDEQRR